MINFKIIHNVKLTLQKILNKIFQKCMEKKQIPAKTETMLDEYSKEIQLKLKTRNEPK